jgi:hypothetical protein
VAGILRAAWASPARADTALDVRILQTASSLEALAVATYDLALGEGPGAADAPAARALAAIPVTSTRDALLTFARETRRQHDEHRKAFQAQTKALDPDAAVQDAPNPKFLPLVTTADLSTPDKLVDFAAVLEKVATDSYLLNLTMLQDTRTKAVMGSVMGVEAQHLATLRVVGALLTGGAPELVAVPLPLSAVMKLPPAIGRVAFPDALHQVGGPELVAEPTSGAVR